jgi:ribonuclease R
MNNKILDYLQKFPLKTFNERQLARLFDLPSAEHKELRTALKELVTSGKIVMDAESRYQYRDEKKVLKGRIKIQREGYGFVIPENNKKQDVFIPEKYVHGAWSGDNVIVESFLSQRSGRYEGRVISVLERAHKVLMGTIQKEGRHFSITCTDHGLPFDVYIPKKSLGKASIGDFAIITIIQYPAPGVMAIGEILKVMEPQADGGDLCEASLIKRGIERDFPSEVKKDLQHIDGEINLKSDGLNRVDLRHLPIMTIDGITAKDFDDAVYVERKGRLQVLYVCIADVSQYVIQNSNLDKEALKRATSVYMPHECIPMLPEKLSNGLCSLKPHEDRYVMTAEIHYDEKTQMSKCFLYPAIIQSKKRATYEEVQAYLDGDGGDFDSDTKKSLDTMHELALKLVKQADDRGGLGFDFPEAEVIFDMHGKVETIQKAQRFFAHKLIEVFMIAANVATAQYLSMHCAPALYRIHDKPNEFKVSSFLSMLKNIGITTKGKKFDPAVFFNEVKGKPIAHHLQSVFLRSLKQAFYSDDNLGHYGLQLKEYCHFTSPIRRYPDLIVHRQLKALMKNSPDNKLVLKNSDLSKPPVKTPAKLSYTKAELDYLGKHCSKKERDAVEVEREVLKIKQMFFMKDYLHEKFFGRISRINKYGISIELDPYFVEGWLPLSAMKDDYYVYMENKLCLHGRRTRKNINIGDRIWVHVEKVDIDSEEILLDQIVQKSTKVKKPDDQPKKKGKKKDRRKKDKGKRR